MFKICQENFITLKRREGTKKEKKRKKRNGRREGGRDGGRRKTGSLRCWAASQFPCLDRPYLLASREDPANAEGKRSDVGERGWGPGDLAPAICRTRLLQRTPSPLSCEVSRKEERGKEHHLKAKEENLLTKSSKNTSQIPKILVKCQRSKDNSFLVIEKSVFELSPIPDVWAWAIPDRRAARCALVLLPSSPGSPEEGITDMYRKEAARA